MPSQGIDDNEDQLVEWCLGYVAAMRCGPEACKTRNERLVRKEASREDEDSDGQEQIEENKHDGSHRHRHVDAGEVEEGASEILVQLIR